MKVSHHQTSLFQTWQKIQMWCTPYKIHQLSFGLSRDWEANWRSGYKGLSVCLLWSLLFSNKFCGADGSRRRIKPTIIAWSIRRMARKGDKGSWWEPRSTGGWLNSVAVFVAAAAAADEITFVWRCCSPSLLLSATNVADDEGEGWLILLVCWFRVMLTNYVA